MSTPRTGGTPRAGRGDDDVEMQPATLVPDDVIDAILDDQPVDTAYAHLVGFADAIRDLGEGPEPRPSSELTFLLEGGEPTVAVEPTQRFRGLGRRQHPLRTQRARRAARVALGTTLVAASVIGAGAAGVLPAAASNTVRDAIEAISPVDFAPHGGGDQHDPTTTTGPRSPEGADGEGGNGHGQGGNRPPEPGTSGDHRPGWSATESEPPGQTGDTGLTRADETPADPNAPETSPSETAPGQTAKADETGTSGSAPSTVPVAHGNQADDHTTSG